MSPPRAYKLALCSVFKVEYDHGYNGLDQYAFCKCTFFCSFPQNILTKVFSHPECTSSCKRKYLKCTQEENHFPKEEKFSPKQNPNFTWNSFGQIWAKFNIIFNFKYFMKCHVHIKAGLGSLQLNLSTISTIFTTISQGDDEPTRHNDGRDSQLPPPVPAVHAA